MSECVIQAVEPSEVDKEVGFLYCAVQAINLYLTTRPKRPQRVFFLNVPTLLPFLPKYHHARFRKEFVQREPEFIKPFIIAGWEHSAAGKGDSDNLVHVLKKT